MNMKQELDRKLDEIRKEKRLLADRISELIRQEGVIIASLYHENGRLTLQEYEHELSEAGVR